MNNRQIPVFRAKVTGGCNSHNVLNYVLGQRKDFDERWGLINGWKWIDLEKYWNHIQNTFKTYKLLDTFEDDIWLQRLIQSAIENNYNFVNDPDDLSNIGIDENITFTR